MFKIDDYITLKNGWNAYKVLSLDGKFMRVECCSFLREENLGDQITIKDLFDKALVCSWHWDKFELDPLL